MTTHKHATLPIFHVDCSVLTFNGKPLTAPPSQRKEIELYLKGILFFPVMHAVFRGEYMVGAQCLTNIF